MSKYYNNASVIVSAAVPVSIISEEDIDTFLELNPRMESSIKKPRVSEMVMDTGMTSLYIIQTIIDGISDFGDEVKVSSEEGVSYDYDGIDWIFYNVLDVRYSENENESDLQERMDDIKIAVEGYMEEYDMDAHILVEEK